MGTKFVCDVEGCDTSETKHGEGNMHAPKGWATVSMEREIPEELQEMGNIDPEFSLPVNIAGVPMAAGVVRRHSTGRRMPRPLMYPARLLVCPEHKLPTFKKAALEADVDAWIGPA